MAETEKKATRSVQVHVIKSTTEQLAPLRKAEQSTNISDDATSASEWIAQEYDMKALKACVEDSTILPQCIRAYGSNIAGYGIGLKYINDEEENEAMIAEWNHAEQIIKALSIDRDTKEEFVNIIHDRETYGIAYVEVLRNPVGEVVGIERIKDVQTISKTVPLGDAQTIKVTVGDAVVERSKRFCKYKQTKNGKTVYYKEFGDPRPMDARTGNYAEEGIDATNAANEILEFTVGTEAYGCVRWFGQVMSVRGAQKAENLNYNYFENGRHTPLAVLVSGGTLSDESREKLTEYVNSIKGDAGQHAFLLFEVDDAQNETPFEEKKTPKVDLKDMAAVLQKDELFQDYLENVRRKVQSAFLLPDIYTGYTTDFNRATALAAMEVTEKQVFQPERESLAWIINHKLLSEYGFKYVEAYFKAPDMTNPDDIASMLTAATAAGGVTPNMAKRAFFEAVGWDGEEDYEDEWGNIPVNVQQTQNAAAAASMNMGNIGFQLDKVIEKAAGNHDDEIVAVLKEVRSLLKRDFMTDGDADDEA